MKFICFLEGQKAKLVIKRNSPRQHESNMTCLQKEISNSQMPGGDILGNQYS